MSLSEDHHQLNTLPQLEQSIVNIALVVQPNQQYSYSSSSKFKKLLSNQSQIQSGKAQQIGKGNVHQDQLQLLCQLHYNSQEKVLQGLLDGLDKSEIQINDQVQKESVQQKMSSSPILLSRKHLSDQLKDNDKSISFSETQNLSIMNSDNNDSNVSFQKSIISNEESDIDLTDLYSVFFKNDLIEFHYKEALKHALKVLEGNNNNKKHESFQNAQVLFNIGKIFLETSQFKNAIQYIQKAQRILKQHYSQKHQFIATVLNGLSMAYDWVSEFKKSQQKAREAQIQCEKLQGRQKLQKKAQNLFALGLISSNSSLDGEEKKKKGLSYYEESLKLYTQLNNGSDLVKDCFKIHNNIATVHFYSNDIKKSAEHLQNCLRIGRTIYKGNVPIMAEILSHCGTVSAKLGNFKNAEEYLQEAKQIFKALNIENKTENAVLAFNYCILEDERKNYKLALKYCEISHQIFKNLVDQKNFYLNETVSKIMELNQKIGLSQKSMINSSIECQISISSLYQDSRTK